jgi:hypothetical protein
MTDYAAIAEKLIKSQGAAEALEAAESCAKTARRAGRNTAAQMHEAIAHEMRKQIAAAPN